MERVFFAVNDIFKHNNKFTNKIIIKNLSSTYLYTFPSDSRVASHLVNGSEVQGPAEDCALAIHHGSSIPRPPGHPQVKFKEDTKSGFYKNEIAWKWSERLKMHDKFQSSLNFKVKKKLNIFV